MRFLSSVFHKLSLRRMDAHERVVIDGNDNYEPAVVPMSRVQAACPKIKSRQRMKSKVEDCDPKTVIENAKDKTKYSLIRRIGTGSISTCYETLRDGKGHFLVLKIVENNTSPSGHQQILNEISCLRRIERHQNIVRFLENFTDTRERICLVMEHCAHGSLADYLEGGGFLSQHLTANVARQILKGVQHIHRQNLVHRDLKLGNILLTSDYIVKITDFGLASPLSECQGATAKLCGTPNYLAPEVCQRKGYSFASDVWSFGVCLYAICTGQVPFHVPADGPNISPDEVISQTMGKIVAGRFSINDSVLPVGARTTLVSVLISNSVKRPRVDQLLECDYLSCSCSTLTCINTEPCRQKSRKRSFPEEKMISTITALVCETLLSFLGDVQHLVWIKCWGQVTADTLHYILSNGTHGVLQRTSEGTRLLHRREDSLVFSDLLEYTQQLELDLTNFYTSVPSNCQNPNKANVCGWHYCADGSIGFLFNSGAWQVNFVDHVKLLIYRNLVVVISGNQGSHENFFNWLHDDNNRVYIRPLCEIVQIFSAIISSGK